MRWMLCSLKDVLVIAYNKPLKTVRITRHTVVFNPEDAVTTSFNTLTRLHKKPHEVMASHPSMQCATSLIKSNAVNSASASHCVFTEYSVSLGQHRAEKRFIIITISILLLSERYMRQAWEPSNKAIVFMIPRRTGQNKTGNVRIT